ncbi:endonuclease domain-containing protein [Subtercola boreus]|nr:DUF559 domain-containing protein [Subtercola boreus]
MPELPVPLTARPFSVSDAETAGVSRHRLRQRGLSAPYRGVRVLTPASPSTDERTEAAALRACTSYEPRLREGEMFWGPTSALLWGCPLPLRSVAGPIHLAVRAPLNAAREKHVIGHQTSLGRTLLVESRRCGLPVPDPATTWLTLAGTLGVHDLVAAGDYFAHVPPESHPVPGRPFVTLDELAWRVERFHGRGKSRASEALPRLTTRAESRPESLLRLLLIDAGLPLPEVNPELADARGGLIGRADLVFRRERVIVEYDGDQHRTDTTQYEKDMTRLERFHLAGWTVLRVRKYGLFTAPNTTVRRVATALARR